ncbi:MAG: hypothetical protein OEQ49_12805 [Myxococcales bacterium]|nr:hypothetical protein [Myxococcales bacterium]
MVRIQQAYFFVAILTVTAVASGAQAQRPKVVVLSFAGAGGATARVQVVRALKGQADFATKSDADRVIDDRGLRIGTGAGRAELSDVLDVDYIFWGRVKGKGSSARTEIRVAGRSGQALTGYEAGAPGTSKGNRLIQEAARTALAEVLELAPPGKSKRKETAAVVATEVSVPTGAAAATTATAPAPPKTKPRPEPRADAKKKSKKKTKADGVTTLPVFEIFVGGGPRLRNIDFDVGDGSGGTESRTFDSGAYADVGGYFLVRPLGRSDNPALQGIVIQGDGGVGFGLNAQPQGTGITNSVSTWRALGQVGYLYPLRKGLQVGGLVGAGVDTFDIDVNSVLPSIQYIYVRVGAALSYMIFKEFVGFRVDGGFRKPFSLGDLEDAFGNNSSAIGFDATAMVGGKLDIGFTYGFRFIWEYYKTDFSGATDPQQPSFSGGPGSGTDSAMTYQFLVGWSL